MLLSEFVFGQDDYRPDRQHRFSLEAGGDFCLQSNSLTNEFMNKYLYGKFIDGELMQKQLNRLPSGMRTGIDLSFQLMAEYCTDTLRKNAIKFWATEHSLVGLRLESDLARLILHGNKQFEGDSAQFSHGGLVAMHYQTFEVGWGMQKSLKRYVVNASIRGGLACGTSRLESVFERGYLYTAPYGEYLDIDVGFHGFINDTAGSDMFKPSGYGFSTGLQAEVVENGKQRFFFGISDIGMLWWDKDAVELSLDTSFVFNGFQIDDVLNIDSTLFGDFNVDSMSQKYIHSAGTVERKTWLPVFFQLEYERKFSREISVFSALSYRMGVYSLPSLLVKAAYSFGNITPSLVLRAGGYGKLSAGIEVQLATSDFHHRLILGSAFLDGQLLPKHTGGQGFYIRYAFHPKSWK